MKKSESTVRVGPPVIFPLGIGLGSSEEDGIIFIEFMGAPSVEPDSATVAIGRYAVPLKKAEFLVEQLTKLISEMKSSNLGD